MKITHIPGARESLRQAIAGLGAAKAKVGWFPSAVYATGAPVAGVAFVQEHGSTKQGIPPRPFMRPTAAEKKAAWAKLGADLVRAAAAGKSDPKKLMTTLALVAEGDVRVAIAKLSTPPLAPATIAARKRRLASKGKGAKGSIGKPLVDTGILLNTLTSVVE